MNSCTVLFFRKFVRLNLMRVFKHLLILSNKSYRSNYNINSNEYRRWVIIIYSIINGIVIIYA